MSIGKLLVTLIMVGLIASGIVDCGQPNPDGVTSQTTNPAVEKPNLANQPTARTVDKEDIDQAKKKLKDMQTQQQ